MNTNDYITTNEAASALGVTRQRVLQLIKDGRLKAEKFANVYMIRRKALSHIEGKPMGRPPKLKNETVQEKAANSMAKKRIRKKDPTRLLKTLS